MTAAGAAPLARPIQLHSLKTPFIDPVAGNGRATILSSRTSITGGWSVFDYLLPHSHLRHILKSSNLQTYDAFNNPKSFPESGEW
jgi:hypothetical protein